jgi:hypothetical protein
LASERSVTVARLRAGSGDLDPSRFATALELLLQQHLVVLRD